MILPTVPRVVNRVAQLVVFCAVPLVGVLAFGWDWRPVILLYWLENISVGLTTLVRILRSRPSALGIGRTTGSPQALARAQIVIGRPLFGPQSADPTSLIARIGVAAFFTVHYGLFTLVHGVFVFVIISGAFSGSAAPALPQLDWGTVILVFVLGTLVQLWFEFRRPRSTEPLGTIMGAPYSRIIVLHLAILGGAFLITMLHWPAVSAVALIALRAIVEVRSWRRERTAPPSTATAQPASSAL